MSQNADGDGNSAEANTTNTQDIYREKPASKIVRVLTVLAYLLSVSLAAILLSIYYICVWRSPVIAKLTDNRDMLSARRGDLSEYSPDFTDGLHSFTGGSDTPVNETATPTTFDNITNFTSANETVETLLDYVENSTVLPVQQEYVPIDANSTNVTKIT